MYFDHTPGGIHPPERDEAHIHAIYRKLFTLVKSMANPDDIARSLINTLQGFFGADGVALCHIFSDDARFVSANGSLSHMENAAVDLSVPFIAEFLESKQALSLSRNDCPHEILSICLNARFESILLVPIAINGMPYGLIALVSNQEGYFEDRDAETIYEIARFLAMLLENRMHEIAAHEMSLYESLGNTCRHIAPELHTATIDLIQTFAQMRRYFVEQKYNLVAEPLKQAVANIENMAKRVQNLRTLGDICLPEKTDFTTIELPAVIDNVIAYNRSQIDECAAIEVTVPQDLPSVYGAYTLIWQTLHEILQNAIRALSRSKTSDKKIGIRAYSLSCVAAVEISDNGAGIEPADIPHIFEPYFSRWENRGLGLTRAQINALRLNGCISYYPAPEGGSIFRVTFPDAQHAPQTEVF